MLVVHLVFAGLWLGCVLTEAIFERALLAKGRDHQMTLAVLHKQVDLFIEIPALLVVVFTGIVMAPSAPLSVALLIKIGIAAMAVLANIYCVLLVFRRLKCAQSSDWDGFARIDHLQHKVGGVVLVGILGAFSIGLYLAR